MGGLGRDLTRGAVCARGRSSAAARGEDDEREDCGEDGRLSGQWSAPSVPGFGDGTGGLPTAFLEGR
jgi:hypothetical protein